MKKTIATRGIILLMAVAIFIVVGMMKPQEPQAQVSNEFIGAIVSFWGSPSQIPSGWELCDGTVVYTAGSSIIGQTKPNLIDKFIRGASGDVKNSPVSGGYDSHSHAIGSHTHSIGTDGSHSHTVNSHTHTVYGHYHNQTTIADGYFPGGKRATEQAGNEGHSRTESNDNQESGASSPGTSSEGVHNHNGQTGLSSATTESASNIPPYVGLLYIIKVK